MNFELSHLFFAALVYLLVLFFIAYATEQGWIPQRIARHPATYAPPGTRYGGGWLNPLGSTVHHLPMAMQDPCPVTKGLRFRGLLEMFRVRVQQLWISCYER